jgi:hypothetical protein
MPFSHKYRIAFLFFVIWQFSFAQYNTEFINYEYMRRSISFNLDFDAGSSGITNSIINKFIYGGKINNWEKQEVLKKQKAVSNFGVNLNYDVSAFVKGNNRFDFLFGFKSQQNANATFTRDFFNLVFSGNKPFLGETANLAGTSINALRFQELKVGAIMHRVDSVAKIGVSISFIKGEQLAFFKANANSSLYTSPDGSELVLNSQFNIALSDTANKNIFAFNGIGASADIFFETPYKSKIGRKSVLTVNANNIGFIHWQNNSVQLSSDSVLRFNGYQVDNILDLKDSTIRKINEDSLFRSLTNARYESFNINIPTNLVIINRIYFENPRYALNTGFRHIFNANYKPYVFAEPEYNRGKFIYSLHFGYGGYTRLNAGFAITYNSKHVFFKIGSNSLQGFIEPRYTFGQGVYFSLAKKFK